MNLKRVGLFVILLLIKSVAFAQCAMCKAVLESNMENGGTAAAGVNDGIIYLMFIPYVLIGTAGYFIYKNYQKNKDSDEA